MVVLKESCAACQERLVNQQKEPLKEDPLSPRVFENTSTDLFQSAHLHVRQPPIRLVIDSPLDA